MDRIEIDAIVFPRMDQMDFAGPFEVLSRIPGARFHVLWKDKAPVRDIQGLTLTPETAFADAPDLDVLVVPGGWGQEQLMEDEQVLSFIREQAAHATYVFSVCTGALLCGAAGLLKGVRATTHWTAFHLLEYFGAIPTDERVVVDGKYVSAAGVTAGIDGALLLVSLLRSGRAAQQIQLAMQYAPEPPFASGSPRTAPPEVLDAVRAAGREIAQSRLETARRVSDRLGIMTDLSYPIGRFAYAGESTAEQRRAFIDRIEDTPVRMRAAVEGLTPEQLDTPYRPGGWTIRQVVHHVPDSHINSYCRFRLALTEDTPSVKGYDEARWAELDDARTATVEVSLALLESLHRRWVLLLRSMTPADFARTFQHSELGPVTLDRNLALYAWHGDHHVAHITALRARMGWA
jgi:cyclohexyl-isocyanide hydratase